jgi:hypothetical protein
VAAGHITLFKQGIVVCDRTPEVQELSPVGHHKD